MSGRGKSMVWQDYQTVYEVVWRGGIVSLDAPLSIVSLGAPLSRESQDPLYEGESRFVDHMESKLPSQESTLIKKEAFLSLSNEAREVIQLILNSPQEILDCFLSPKYNKISRDKIRDFLAENKRWKPKAIFKCFQELKEFSSNFH